MLLERALLSAWIFALSIVVMQVYGVYLDSVLTLGLLRSVQTEHPHALCAWDSALQSCSPTGNSLALVDHHKHLVSPIFLLPQSTWTLSSFSGQQDAMTLSVYDKGVVHGRMAIDSFLGRHFATLSPSGRLKTSFQFIGKTVLLKQKAELSLDHES